MPRSLNYKVALITGAAQGIGGGVIGQSILTDGGIVYR